jgi:two-component system, OmpR family, sensor kinase
MSLEGVYPTPNPVVGPVPSAESRSTPRRGFHTPWQIRRRLATGVSIRLRLTLWYSAVLAISLIGFGLLLYFILDHTLDAEADRQLAYQAREIAGTSRVRESSPPGSYWIVLPDVDVFASPNVYVQVTTLEGAVQARSGNLDKAVLPVGAGALEAARRGASIYEEFWLDDVADGRRLRIYSAPLVIDDGTLVGVLQVARPLMSTDAPLNQLRLILTVMGAISLVVAMVAGWVMARAALLPIDRLAQAAQDIGAAQDFERRVAHRGPRDEVGRLAVTFNEMLGRLQSAYQHLEAALAAQRRFIADASHELRTPLTSIRGNIGFLRRVVDMDPLDREEALADVASEVERMSRLVGDLLTLARADAGQHLPKTTVEMAPLVREVARQARFLSDGEVEVSLGRVDETRVHGDPDHLKQLLLILADNAVKYTPAGGQVSLAASRENGQLRLEVADSGVGISPDDQQRVFERFYRADPARSRGGAGLGLAIARWIAEEHGGSIAVRSTLGQGSVFTVELPVGEPVGAA